MPWAPAALATIACAVILVAFQTPLSAVALYALYWLLTAALPGTLLWRMLGVRPRSAFEEIVIGTVLGLGVQVFLVFALGRLGLPPRAAVVWCIAVIVLSIAVPGLRRVWRSEAAARLSPWMSWPLALVSTGAVWWLANTGFRFDPIAKVPGFPGQYYPTGPYVDMPFHQALAAAVLRGGTGYPYVPMVPLQYTLMVYEHMADFTRWTGVDLTLVVMRLYAVPVLVLAVLLCGVIVHRITGSAAAGALGGLLGYFSSPASMYGNVHNAFNGIEALTISVYRSPTQTFGEPLFLGLLLVLVILLRERVRSRWLYAVVAVLAFVAGGAKTTFLPMIVCGLALALVIGWIARARRSWTLLTLLVISGAAFIASLEFVTGTGSRDLAIGNGTDLIKQMGVTPALGPILERPVVRVAAIALVIGVWLLAVVGGFAATILRRRDLTVWLLTGIGVAGIGATILGSHPSLSQTYFLRSAWPVLGLLSAIGFAALVRRAQAGRRLWLVVVLSLILGLGVALLVQLISPFPEHYHELILTYGRLSAPYVIVVLVGLAVGTAVTLVAQRRKPRSRGAAIALALLVAMGVVQGSAFSDVVESGLLPLEAPASGEGAPLTSIPADGAAAARWLRAHSQTSDLIATNIHCLGIGEPNEGCIPRSFWLSALTERNVLVEGWEYATPSHQMAPHYAGSGPFWDPAFLAENDRAIYAPSAATVAWLKARSVKWVFVDSDVQPPALTLKNYLQLVYQKGDFTIYRVR